MFQFTSLVRRAPAVITVPDKIQIYSKLVLLPREDNALCRKDVPKSFKILSVKHVRCVAGCNIEFLLASLNDDDVHQLTAAGVIIETRDAGRRRVQARVPVSRLQAVAELPVVDASLSDLQRHDFAPFRELNHLPMAMTAHVVYSAIDPKNPATTSSKVIDEIIRREIGFDGLLMSDDTSMKALSGDFPTKAASILAAGCDLVLHCNGVFEEMVGIASRTKGLEGKSLERAKRAMTYIKKSDTVEETEIRAEFATYFDAVA